MGFPIRVRVGGLNKYAGKIAKGEFCIVRSLEFRYEGLLCGNGVRVDEHVSKQQYEVRNSFWLTHIYLYWICLKYK